MPRISRPNLYRTVKVVLTDGSTFRVPSAIRMAGNTFLAERDSSNHPVYLGTSDASGLLSKRDEARLEKIRRRQQRERTVFDADGAEEESGDK